MRVEYGALSFTQTRHMAGVRVPLVSRGVTEIAVNSVDWHIVDPLDIRTTITSAGITQSIDNGPAQHIASQAGSGALLTGAGLFDVLVGDVAAIGVHYTIARARPEADGRWSMSLIPRAAGLARFISSIKVAGCSRIDDVEVRQVNGDWMEIALTPVER